MIGCRVYLIDGIIYFNNHSSRPSSELTILHVCQFLFPFSRRSDWRIGLGRSKFLPKPLPQEINMLLSECELNCRHDGSEKSTLPPPPPMPLSTTILLPTSLPPSSSTTVHIMPTTNVASATTVSFAPVCDDGSLTKADPMDDEDDDESRGG